MYIIAISVIFCEQFVSTPAHDKLTAWIDEVNYYAEASTVRSASDFLAHAAEVYVHNQSKANAPNPLRTSLQMTDVDTKEETSPETSQRLFRELKELKKQDKKLLVRFNSCFLRSSPKNKL